jgi:hypothetical protein
MCPSIHKTCNLGLTTKEEFNNNLFEKIASRTFVDLAFIDPYCGQFLEDFGKDKNGNFRQEAMPFIVHKDIWERHGPMDHSVENGALTGDTRFFDSLYRDSEIELCVSRGSISYHCGGIETKRLVSA